MGVGQVGALLVLSFRDDQDKYEVIPLGLKLVQLNKHTIRALRVNES